MSIRLDEALQGNLAAYAKLCAEAGWPVRLELLPEALERIVEFYRPVKLYAFGSLVRGDFTAHSDLDLLIVVPDDAEKERRSSMRARQIKSDTAFPMDILLVGASDFERRRKTVTLIHRTVDREGQVLYAA
jgi:predicted nucleotidyltransferase